MLRSKFYICFISLVCIVLSTACSSIVGSKVEIPKIYQLQSIPERLNNHVILESLTFKRNDEQKLLTQVEFSDQQLSMVAMTYSGIPIIQAKWHEESGLTELVSEHFSKAIVLQIIRDIQWVKWPRNIIEKGLNSGYTIKEVFDGMSQKNREISYNNKAIVTIDYTSNKIVLHNYKEQYELVIENLNDK